MALLKFVVKWREFLFFPPLLHEIKNLFVNKQKDFLLLGTLTIWKFESN